MRSVLSGYSNQPDPSTHPGSGAVGEPMSLYRAGLKLAFFLPLGVAMPPSHSRTPSGFADVSSVLNPDLSARRDPLIEPPSVSPRVQDLRT